MKQKLIWSAPSLRNIKYWINLVKEEMAASTNAKIKSTIESMLLKNLEFNKNTFLNLKNFSFITRNLTAHLSLNIKLYILMADKDLHI